MFKTTFKKLMAVFSLVLFACFCIAYLVLTLYSSRYAVAQKTQSITTIASDAAALTEKYVNYIDFTVRPSGVWELYAGGIASIAASTNTDIIILRSDSGQIIAMSRQIEDFPLVIPEKILGELKSSSKSKSLDEYFKFETLSAYVQINPEILSNVGVLVCMSKTNATSAVLSFLQTTMLICIFIFLIGFVLVYVISRRMTSALNAINSAAQQIALGNFDVSAPVTGKGEIDQLAHTFNSMAASLRELNNTQTSFIANVSHELRTPMTTISGFIENILNGTIPSEKRDEYLKIVLEESKRLSRMVTDMLDISKMSLGQFSINKSQFDICELTRLTIIKFENKIDEKHLDVSVSIPDSRVSVIADKDAITRVITNLMDNAVKFSDEGNLISIAVSVQSNKAYVAVTNDGDGIDEKSINYVFDRFYKTDSSRNNKNGTGLGLYMVKNIINMHGENIAVKSILLSDSDFDGSSHHPLRRTTFIFTLPLA